MDASNGDQPLPQDPILLAAAAACDMPAGAMPTEQLERSLRRVAAAVVQQVIRELPDHHGAEAQAAYKAVLAERVDAIIAERPYYPPVTTSPLSPRVSPHVRG